MAIKGSDQDELSERMQSMKSAGTGGSGRAGWLRSVISWERRPPTPAPVCLSTEEYNRMGEEGVAESWKLLHSGKWQLEKRGGAGDVVESSGSERYGKIYRFTGTVDCPARWLYEDLKDNYETMPKWNPTILKCQTIKKVSPGLEIGYQVTEGGGGGLVTARDFVMLRALRAVDSEGRIVSDTRPADPALGPAAFLVTGVSIELPDYPPVKEYVRGVTKIGSWIMRPTENTENGKKCTFQWLFSCDLKGRMPAFVVDTAMATVMLDTVGHVRRHAAAAGFSS